MASSWIFYKGKELSHLVEICGLTLFLIGFYAILIEELASSLSALYLRCLESYGSNASGKQSHQLVNFFCGKAWIELLRNKSRI